MVHSDVIVVGGGLAGLAAAMKSAEKGLHVTLISMMPAKRSHSVCAQGGINAAMNLKGEEDSPYIHAYDTMKGGDFLGDQPPILEMCLAAPKIIRMMERFGCTFNRTKEGNLDFRRFGGTLHHRTAFCGASTGQQLVYALDEQVRKYEAHGKIRRLEHHEFLRLVIDEEGVTRGLVMMDHRTMQIEVLKSDVVVLATGGSGQIFKKSTNSVCSTGAASGRIFRQGARYANGEFIQIHPTAIPGTDKLRLISESVRGEGGRLFVWGDASKTIKTPDGESIPCGKTGEKWYFLEELYPLFGNLVPRDIGAREILRVCEMGLGNDKGLEVNLEVSHLPVEDLYKLEAVLDIYQKFTGDDPRKVPMKIFPAVHYSMGGIWVDWPAADDPDRWERYRQMTNIPGCFNVGESEYLYHGANRLGANSLLSCLFAGLVAGGEVKRYFDSLETRYDNIESSVFDNALAQEEAFKHELLNRNGSENVHALHDELADLLVANVAIKRNNKDLQKTVDGIKAIQERYQNITLSDRGECINQTYLFASQFQGMLDLALVITKGALLRNEFRGAHYKPEFPERDDTNWLKTTIATYNQKHDEPEITYIPVDTRHLKPLKRDYTSSRKEPHALENIPDNIVLPL